VRHNGLQVLLSGDRAEVSPARPLARSANESTLAFLLREAVKLARGRKDPTLVWLLHKAIERMKGAGNEQTI
jgi:hypothetical protein